MGKPKNQTQAIRQFCSQCIYDSLGGNGGELTQITNCTSKDCPLYNFRPLNKDAKEVAKQAKIAAMSPEELKKYNEKCEIAGKRFKNMKSEGKI